MQTIFIVRLPNTLRHMSLMVREPLVRYFWYSAFAAGRQSKYSSSRKSSRKVGEKGLLPRNWGGTEQNRTVTCMLVKAKANDMRKNLALVCD
ncbi:hypothetical protein TNCV_3079651 [Trichonephila clavipes]|nr:hypothetical protein TNCV_3079651 [Trichonephila clavipes]